MMMFDTFAPTAPIAPTLVASALDCLSLVPRDRRLEPALLVAITRTVSATDSEAAALLVRIRAAATVLCDPRWPPWSNYFKACTPDAHATFDSVVLDLVATLPLDSSLRFSADLFFQTLIARVPAAWRH